MPAHDCTSPGQPNAHFNFRRGTGRGGEPGAGRRLEGARWWRFWPKPFHTGAAGVIVNVPRPVVHIAFGAGAIENAVPKLRRCELGDGAALRGGAQLRHRRPSARFERVENALRAHGAERLARRRAIDAVRRGTDEHSSL
jgi:hypothetical protein